MKESISFEFTQQETIDLFRTKCIKPIEGSNIDVNNNSKLDRNVSLEDTSIKRRIQEFRENFFDIKNEFIKLEENLNVWKRNFTELQIETKRSIIEHGSENVKKNGFYLNYSSSDEIEKEKNDAQKLKFIGKFHKEDTLSENVTKAFTHDQSEKQNSLPLKKKGKVASKIAFFEKLNTPTVIRSIVPKDDRKLMNGIVSSNIRFYEFRTRKLVVM